MAVTLEWIRDNYDTSRKDRLIDQIERMKAQDDYFDDKITLEQVQAVEAAHDNQTLLPEYDSQTSATLEWIRDNYDTNKNRLIDQDEVAGVNDDYYAGKITLEQGRAVIAAHDNQTLLPEYDSSSMSLEWIRDNYDVNKDRHIENDERLAAYADYMAGNITYPQYLDVFTAYMDGTLLPEYDTPTPTGCTVGDRRCESGTTDTCQECVRGATNYWRNVKICPSGQHCSGGYCVSDTTPPASKYTVSFVVPTGANLEVDGIEVT